MPADFNGDQKADILWRNYGTGFFQGWNLIWYMDGTTLLQEVMAGPVIRDTTWMIAGTGDFNGDQVTDILWRNYDGTGPFRGWNLIWFMAGTTISQEVMGGPVVLDLDWRIDGAGGFDSDGNSDIIWRNYGAGQFSGWNLIWHMNGATLLQEVMGGPIITDLNWRIVNR